MFSIKLSSYPGNYFQSPSSSVLEDSLVAEGSVAESTLGQGYPECFGVEANNDKMSSWVFPGYESFSCGENLSKYNAVQNSTWIESRDCR